MLLTSPDSQSHCDSSWGAGWFLLGPRARACHWFESHCEQEVSPQGTCISHPWPCGGNPDNPKNNMVFDQAKDWKNMFYLLTANLLLEGNFVQSYAEHEKGWEWEKQDQSPEWHALSDRHSKSRELPCFKNAPGREDNINNLKDPNKKFFWNRLQWVCRQAPFVRWFLRFQSLPW